MCGIAGIFSVGPCPDMPSQIAKVIGRALHRGPDDRGIILGKGCETFPENTDVTVDWALGHVRLAILDLSSAGHQPMSRTNGKFWICFNGEIYNYLEIRTELIEQGHEFRSSTDTEVILAAYESWGPSCVKRFVGMFAFIIVDLRERSVFVARDRLGVKPLYIWQDSARAVLVSEPKQLLGIPTFRPRAHRQQIVDYLTEGLLGHTPDQCCFDSVRPLPPGCTLSWRLGELPDLAAALPYWTPSLISRNISWEEAVEETEILFKSAIELRLRSDVPVGSCLSGGVDSSSIVGAVSRGFGQSIKTFSICSMIPDFDERPYIDAVTVHCHNTAIKIILERENIVEELEEVVYCQDEPFPSLTIYAQWCLMRAARREGVPVLLDGQGGDETLCGYRKFAFFRLRDLLTSFRFFGALSLSKNLLLQGDNGLLSLKEGQRYLPGWLRCLKDDMPELLRSKWRPLARPVWSVKMKNVEGLHNHQWADLKFWSLPVLLRYEDRNSMAHAVESRLPFLDHRFVEHCLTLPESFFLRQGRTKRVLTEALGDLLPIAVKTRRTKSHFNTSESVLLRGRLGEFLEKRIRKSERLAAIIDVDAATKRFRQYRNGNGGHTSESLFRLAGLAMWLDRFEVEV
jgi:asparagine synthase (glutamine-hydrolysing)